MRDKGGSAPYSGGFIEHYLSPIIYPHGLTREIQIGLGILLLGTNLGIYWRVWRRRRRPIVQPNSQK